MRRVLVCLAVLIATAACQQPTETQPDVTGSDTYVAIGDSYTSGPGIAPAVADSGPCQRSKRNYPSLVAERIGLKLVDVSCGSATTANVLDTPQAGAPAVQIDAVTESTVLVTVGIGANDGYSTRLFSQCVFAKNPGRTCGPFVNEDLEPLLDRIEVSVGTILDAVQQRAPQATVLLVGYLSFASGAPCDVLDVPADTLKLVHEAEQRLADVMSRVARTHDVRLVPMTQLSIGHDPCSDEPWTNGTTETRDDGAWLHPRRAGMEATADAVIDALDAETAAAK